MSKSSKRKPPAAHLAAKAPAVTAADTAPAAVMAARVAKVDPAAAQAVPADAPGMATALAEAELGQPVHVVFPAFSAEPLAFENLLHAHTGSLPRIFGAGGCLSLGARLLFESAPRLPQQLF